ncbi:IDEAL domain-containing protein [Saliterribacillus persicus]|uniref:IDEAL domain-containing protein n=1 Tax=Saliterribacillus persicus TaxID=930114 RepID=A0A368XNV5_9BACI|nr:IDEAL domain-containing protein [Saliterribacillus persicus]RCW69643.1 IDEAL domain-containing protein [Saliterribacillus persicus]
MKKQKVNYRLRTFTSNKHLKLIAKREVSYEIKLASQLILDELCFSWNHARLEEDINQSIDEKNEEKFKELSESYNSYIWEY